MKIFIKTLIIVIAVALLAMGLVGCSGIGGTTYSVTFVAGDGATGTAPAVVDQQEAAVFTLPANTFNKPNHLFKGWFDGTNTYQPDASYTMPAEAVTFTATWELAVGYSLSDDGTSYLFSSCDIGVTSVVIDATYNGKPVTGISEKALNGCSALASVTIPASVSSIGSEAFSGCNNLTSITIPKGVTSIGDGVFTYCRGLTEIIVEDRNPRYRSNGNCLIDTINKNLVAGCNTSIIPTDGSVTSIGNYVFSGCNLTTITIPEGVTSIGDGVFSGCTALETVTFEINCELRIIGLSAFYGCSALTSITIPASVTSIGGSAFSGWTNSQTINCEATSALVGWSFWDSNCSANIEWAYRNITSNISYDYVVRGEQAYLTKYKGRATAIEIPTQIDGYDIINIGGIFSGNTSITSISIPSSVTSIGERAFAYCSGLAEIIVESGNLKYHSDGNCLIETASKTLIAGCKTSVIPTDGSVTSIGSEAFYGCSALSSITIPESVTSIGEGAFSGCSSLVSISLPFVGGSAKTATDTYQYPLGYLFGTASYTGGAEVWQNYYGSSTRYTTHATYYIPSALRNVTLTGSSYLPRGAFEDCSMLTDVALPASMTSIGSYAFSRCSSLKTITFDANSTLLSIGDNSFYDCRALKAIIIPASVTSIVEGAFYDCTTLETVTFEANSNLLSIDSEAFSGCSALSSITIPSSVTSIALMAFYNCTSLETVLFSNTSSLEIIGAFAFYNCAALTTITIPASVTSIGNSAFGDCYGLTTITVETGNSIYKSKDNCLIETATKTLVLGCKNSAIPADGSVTIIAEYAFDGCSALTTVTIPTTVTSISEGAFFGCSSLVSISLPFVGGSAKTATDTYQYPLGYIFGKSSYTGVTRVTQSYYGDSTRYTTSTPYCIPSTLRNVTLTGSSYIPRGAFYNCNMLTTITIPASVTSIGSYAFSGCSGLTDIIVESGSPKYHSDGNCLIETASKTLIAGCNTSIIPTDGSVTSIGESAFSGCSGLTTITIPASVTSIYSYAFYNCGGLTDIIVESGNPKYHSDGNCLIETASKTLIAGCNTSIIPTDGSVTSIGESAFYNCSGLTTITISASVTSIYGLAFRGCTSLEAVTFEANSTLQSIGGSAFSGCSGLTTITIPASVTSIGSYAFYGCSALTSITIPDSVTSIDGAAFRGCTSLEAVIFEENSALISIGYESFYNCSGLTTITIPTSVTSIGGSAFYNCSGLTTITIPTTATSIYYGVFSGWTSSQTIYFEVPSALPGWDYYWNRNCSANIVWEYNNVTSNATFDYVVHGGEVYLTKYKGVDTVVVVPNQIEGKNVVDIGSIFTGNTSITSITIPASVTSIGGYAFRNCSALQTVTFVNNGTLQSIGSYSFYGCRALTTITIPASVISIGAYAFYNCTSLEVVTFEANSNLQSIGSYAFNGCSALSSVTFSGTGTWYRTYSQTDWANKTGGTAITLGTPEENATLLKTTYCANYWYKL